jgi:23S rRNA (guanosine2251-2'-O)-methyltransferase
MFPKKQTRPDEGKDLVFGIRPVQEVLASDQEIERVLVQKELENPLIGEIVRDCRARHIPLGRVPEEKLNRITRKQHQGVVAFITSVQYASLDHVVSSAYNEGRNPFILMLDRVTDVRNFGAIVRTAECAGVDAIIIPDRGAARLSGDAFKTSAGALGHLPICREHSLVSTVRYLRNHGLQIVGCTEKSSRTIYSVDFGQPMLVIVGSEEDGIAPELLELCDRRAKIPLQGKISSLNVSVAAALVLYEAVRQKLPEEE